MLSILTDTLPKPVLAGAALWAGVSYFATGPEFAARIARADYMPACTANIHAAARQAGEQRARAVPMPGLDPMDEYAAAQVRRLQNNPLMDHLRAMSGGRGDLFGINDAANAALERLEQARRQAKEAYESSLARIRQETATHLARAGDVCGCIADAAIAETRTEWAIYAGTLTLIEPRPIEAFDEKMAQVQGAGACRTNKAGS